SGGPPRHRPPLEAARDGRPRRAGHRDARRPGVPWRRPRVRRRAVRPHGLRQDPRPHPRLAGGAGPARLSGTTKGMRHRMLKKIVLWVLALAVVAVVGYVGFFVAVMGPHDAFGMLRY